MNRRLQPGTECPGLRPGFTLIELMVVMTIIGIIIAFLLTAAGDARRRAEEDATLALITKLEGGVIDRLDSLLQTRPDPNFAHIYMAGIYTAPSNSTVPISQATTRAQVFAWYDYIKSELPDVFFVQTTSPYPLNFAFPLNGYPGGTIDQQGLGNFILPLGNSVIGPLIPIPGVSPTNGFTAGYGAGNFSNTLGTGIFGASYFAAAGLYKNISAGGITYLPKGYDGIDNDGNGLVDEISEGIPSTTDQTTFRNALQITHQHSTARSETLYAILVEGVGPLGSVFSRDDFSDREVQDTDGDGLPEFVDAWGKPLQFFRWPLLYHTDTQRGQVIDTWDYTQSPPFASAVEIFNPPYRSVFESREQDPLDPNQQLMAPAWWWSGVNSFNPIGFTGSASAPGGSSGVIAFESFFHRLTEPFQHVGSSPTAQYYWDRGSTFPYRRAFFSKPLILSSGPDGQLGVYQWPNGSPPTAATLLMIENNAMPFDPTQFSGETIPAGSALNAATLQLRNNGRDDVSNQSRPTSGGGGS